jgi:glycosyltransferase involved in cell wall biosynthesis
MNNANSQPVMLPISVCLVAGAEAQRIGRALASVAGWTREIIVVLNEEVADGTDLVAAQYGARVYRHPWQGFREQKNLVLTYATQPWILSLDADEEISPALHEEIRAFLLGPEPNPNGASMPRKVWFLGRWITHGDWYPDRVLRLFRRGHGRWAGTPEHCYVKVAGSCVKLKGDLHHYTNPTIGRYVAKMSYYADFHLQRQLTAQARWSPWRSPASIILRVVWRWVRAYFFRRGFLDGYPGFFIAVSNAYATLIKHSRLYEHEQPAPPPRVPPTTPP